MTGGRFFIPPLEKGSYTQGRCGGKRAGERILRRKRKIRGEDGRGRTGVTGVTAAVPPPTRQRERQSGGCGTAGGQRWHRCILNRRPHWGTGGADGGRTRGRRTGGGDGGNAAAHGTAGVAERRGRDGGCGTAGGQRWHRCILDRRPPWGTGTGEGLAGDGRKGVTAAEPPPTRQQGWHSGGGGTAGDSDGIAEYRTGGTGDGWRGGENGETERTERTEKTDITEGTGGGDGGRAAAHGTAGVA